MQPLPDQQKKDTLVIPSATLEGYTVKVNAIRKNSNNENHHYSFLVCLSDQSVVRVTKFLSKVPACMFRTHLQESMKTGRGATISGLRDDNGQYFCTANTKLEIKDLPYRPICVRVQSIQTLKSSTNERLCTIEAKVVFIGEESAVSYEDIGFKRVQKLKKIIIVGDETGALEMTLWDTHFNEVSLGKSFQIRLAKLRSYNDQISLVATSETSFVYRPSLAVRTRYCFAIDYSRFMEIEGIEKVVEQVDHAPSRHRVDEGRIIGFHKNNDQYVCQACGSTNITVQHTCLLCNVCRCRTEKEDDTTEESFRIMIATNTNNEYSLTITKTTLMSVSSIYDQLSTYCTQFVNEANNINTLTSLRVHFEYDALTGIIKSIVPMNDPNALSVQSVGNASNESVETTRPARKKQKRTTDETDTSNL